MKIVNITCYSINAIPYLAAGSLGRRDTRPREDDNTKLSSIGVVDVLLGGTSPSICIESAHEDKSSSKCICTSWLASDLGIVTANIIALGRGSRPGGCFSCDEGFRAAIRSQVNRIREENLEHQELRVDDIILNIHLQVAYRK